FGNVDLEQVHGLANGGCDGDGSIGLDEIFDDAAQKNGLAFLVDGDILVAHFFRDLAADRIEPRVITAHKQVEEQAIAALLPYDQARLAGRLAVYQHLARRDRDRFRNFAIGDGHAFNGRGRVDED